MYFEVDVIKDNFEELPFGLIILHLDGILLVLSHASLTVNINISITLILKDKLVNVHLKLKKKNKNKNCVDKTQ